MKKLSCLALYMSLLSGSLLGQGLGLSKDALNRWNNIYSVQKWSDSALSAVAAGTHYLMNETPEKASETLISFHEFCKKNNFHADCYNALVKAYEQAILSSAMQTTSDTDKKKAWHETLSGYYKNVVEKLENKPVTIAFGKDEGKELPKELGLPEADSIFNNYMRPRPTLCKMAPQKKQQGGISFRVVWVAKSI